MLLSKCNLHRSLQQNTNKDYKMLTAIIITVAILILRKIIKKRKEMKL